MSHYPQKYVLRLSFTLIFAERVSFLTQRLKSTSTGHTWFLHIVCLPQHHAKTLSKKAQSCLVLTVTIVFAGEEGPIIGLDEGRRWLTKTEHTVGVCFFEEMWRRPINESQRATASLMCLKLSSEFIEDCKLLSNTISVGRYSNCRWK